MNLFGNQRKVYSTQEQITAIEQNIRTAMDFISKRTRMMGYDPRGSKLFGLTSASFVTRGAGIVNATSLYFTCDRGSLSGAGMGNGTLENVIGERYAFYLSGTDLMLGDINPDTGALLNQGIVLANNVDLFNITYFYSNGIDSTGKDKLPATNDDFLPSGGNIDTGSDLDDVRRIIVTIRGRSAVSDPDYTSPIDRTGFRAATYSSSISPRNLHSVLVKSPEGALLSGIVWGNFD